MYEAQKTPHFRARPEQGRLLPYQSADITISFCPAQLGAHKQKIPFFLYGSTGQKVGMVDVRASGVSKCEGKKALLGGLQATDDTFQPNFNFQGPEQLHIQKTAPRTKWEREKHWVKFPPVVDDVTVAWTFGADKFEEIKSNEDKYLDWLRGNHAQRRHLASDAETVKFALGNHVTGVDCGDPKNDPDYEKPALDLGLFGLPTKGLPGSKTLKEPTLALPVADEPLYLKHRPGEGPSYIKPKTKIVDDSKLISTKFKPGPTTKREKQECSAFLNPKQIMQISTYPAKMEFGQVCIGSNSAKSFAITNGTAQFLLVRIDIHGDKVLERTTPMSQVIPPGTMAGMCQAHPAPLVLRDARFCWCKLYRVLYRCVLTFVRMKGFDITLFLESQGRVETKFSYVINEHHSFEVQILAQAVPVMLHMSRDKIQFAFSGTSNEMSVPETLYLVNPSNNVAEYAIGSHANFSPFPATGSVQPMGEEEVLIYYKPGQTTKHEASLQVDVKGGKSMQLACAGETDQGQIVCNPKSLDFGTVPAGSSARKALTLKAQGDNLNVFFVDPDDLKNRCPGLTVTPDKGMLPPGGNLQLIAAVKSSKPVKIDSYFIVQVRGGKNIKMPVKVDVAVPAVKILEDQIDFGSVYLGANAVHPITMKNVSEIPAIFTLDLRKYPEFSVNIPAELEFEEDSESGDGMPTAGQQDGSIRQGPIAKFCIPEQGEGKIELMYSPESEETPAFELPLSLRGVEGRSKEGKALRRAVVAESAKPRLLLSTPSINFETKIVVGENMKDFSYNIEVTLTNCDDQNCLVEARLEGEAAAAGVFSMAETATDLAPTKSTVCKVMFTPRADGDYRCKMRVYVDHNLDEPYFDLVVTGSGMYPSLGFDRREVFLPLTPVGQTSTVTFEVINYGYDNLDIKHTLPADATTVPMTLNFPFGTMTNVVNTRVPVEVSFSAKKSMSFCTKIEFSDHNGNKYVIPVIGTTDASMFTVFPFVTINKDSIVIKGGERPPCLSIAGPIQKCRLNDEGEIEMDDGGASMNDDAVQLLPPNSEFLCECKVLSSRESVKALLEWANVTIFRTPVSSFPGDLLDARGKQIIEVIEASTGKTVPGQIKKVPATRKEEGEMLLTQYTEMLATLKGYGGLVNSVKPEYLLPPDLFHKLYLDKGGLPVDLRPFYHQHYQVVMEGSWMTLLYQVVKLFVFNRLTPKLLKSTPGVDPAYTKDLHLSGSNVYSPSELVLLGWYTYHYLQMFPGEKHVLNFEQDLHDCRVFGAVIANHVPSLARTLASLKKADAKEDRMANAQQVVAACKSIGLGYCPSASQLASAPARDMMLFAIYLFNTLPALLPRATIDFDGRLNDTVTKHIELTNPSGRPLVYSVKIDGDCEFTCADSLKIGARDRIKFPVHCFHKFQDAVSAQIFFVGERVAGGSAGITLVFDLKSSVRTFKRTEVFTKDALLYEQISFEIPIKNLDKEKDSNVTISIVPLQPAPRGEKGAASKVRSAAAPAGKNKGVTSSVLLPEMTFWTKLSQMKVKRNGSAVVKVNLLPLQLCGHSCLVFVKDDIMGETCYELQAKVDLPAQTDFSKFQHQMKSTIVRDSQLPLRNPAIDKCRTGIMDLMGAEKGKEWFKKVFEQSQIDYKVEYLAECFSGPKTFSLYGPNAKPPPNATPRQQVAMNNKLPLELRPIGPGKYEGRVILRSAFDVRVLDVEATVTAMGTRAELTFSCPARQAISQDIPIINHSNTPWVIDAALNGEYFSGNKNMTVPAATDNGPGIGTYTLTFAPAWIASVQGTLNLRNTTIGDSYQYELTGTAEDPVAESHIVIKCVARKRQKDSLTVRNILGTEDVTYQVECDLLGLSGEDTLHVSQNSEAAYELNIMMPRGGIISGSISFKAPNGHFIWYTLEVEAENPASERDIELVAQARTAIIADIPITNPLDKEITFDVLLEGEGLIGESSITIAAGSAAKYELIYSPLLKDHSEGKLTFVNMLMGEFWYALYLHADEADVITCERMEAVLGKTGTLQLFVENPISRDVTLDIQVTNPRNFRVDYTPKEGASYRPDLLEVGAYSESAFFVTYVPSALDEVEETQVILSHPKAGRWVYVIQGTGYVDPNPEPPWDGKGCVEMAKTIVSAEIGQASNNLLVHRNPLNRQITVQIRLLSENGELDTVRPSSSGQPRPWQVLLPHLTLRLEPFEEIEVPFLFCPTQMIRHSTSVVLEVVEMDSKPLEQKGFCFVYPIEGTAEAPGTMYLGKFSTRAREPLDTFLELPLSGADPIDVYAKVFEELNFEEQHLQALNKCLSLKRDRSPDAQAKLKEGVVRYHLLFDPLKAMRSKVSLKISLETGGAWHFQFDLLVQDADVDDVINIEGAIAQTRSVSFRMTNQFDERTPFNAYFTADSSAEFTVQPEMGLLEPYSSSEGTQFVVSFKPNSYGKLFKGRLVVETDEMQWAYQVNGHHPKYVAPKHAKTKVDTHIQPDLDPGVYKERQTGHKYLQENAAALRAEQKQVRRGAAELRRNAAYPD